MNALAKHAPFYYLVLKYFMIIKKEKIINPNIWFEDTKYFSTFILIMCLRLIIGG